jgi:hypothetical protein
MAPASSYPARTASSREIQFRWSLTASESNFRLQTKIATVMWPLKVPSKSTNSKPHKDIGKDEASWNSSRNPLETEVLQFHRKDGASRKAKASTTVPCNSIGNRLGTGEPVAPQNRGAGAGARGRGGEVGDSIKDSVDRQHLEERDESFERRLFN